MKTNKKFKASIIFTIIVFAFQISLFSPSLFAQSIEHINEDIGGSGNNAVQADSKTDNTFLYIAAGAIVVGLIVWKVFLDKKEPKNKDEIKTDSTKTSFYKPIYKNINEHELQLEKIQNQFPFEVFLGYKFDDKYFPNKKLSVGLRFKL